MDMNAVAWPSTSLPFCFLVTCLQVVKIGAQHPPAMQARAPHGLAYESPVSFSPSAFDFFHPSSGSDAPPSLPSLSVASSEARVQERIWASPEGNIGGRGVGAGGTVAILLALILVVLVAMGAYHVFIRRHRATTNRAIAVRPDA